MDDTDGQLLADYLAGSKDAATTLVHRHIDLVYAAALRRTRDAAMADDVTQAVFVLLTSKAGRLQRRPSVAGWLLAATRHVALTQQRSAARRRRHEFAAAKPEATMPDAPLIEVSQAPAPRLDEAIAGLRPADRDAIVLRYFKHHTAAELGRVFGISEAAAAKRVTRAVERLRTMLMRSGVRVSPALLAATAEAYGHTPAPPAVVAATIAVVSPMAAAGSVKTAATVKGIWTMIASHKVLLGSVLTLSAIGGTAVAVKVLDEPPVPPVAANVAPPATTLPAASRPALPPLPDRVPSGRVAIRVLSPAGPADISDISSIYVFIDGDMRWSMGPKPQVIDRYADGWVTVDKSMYALGHDGSRTETTVLADGAALVATSKIGRDASRVEYTTPARPQDVIDLTAGPATVAADEVAGRVVGPDGKPVAGATVSLPGSDFPDVPAGSPLNRPYRPAVTTDADGVFRFGDFARQWFLYLQVDAPGYASRRLTDLPIGRPFTVRLDNRTRLAGRFVKTDGTSPGVSTLTLLTDKPTARPRMSNPITDIALTVTTDADGRYDVPVEPGVYDIRVTTASGAVARHRRVEIVSGKTISLPAELGHGLPMRIRAIDSLTGKPIEGVRFALEDHRPGMTAQRKGSERGSAADGTAYWEHLTAGTEAISIAATGYSKWWVETPGKTTPADERGIDAVRVEVTPAMSEVVVKLEPAVRVTGTVLAPDGSPVSNAMVDIAGLSTGDARYMVRTDAAGRFAIAFPPLNDVPGPRSASQPKNEYAVIAFDTGGHWANAVSATFTPHAGESKEFTLRMTPGGRVTGRVVDRAGRPVAGIEVEAAADDGLDRNYYNPRQLTDDTGHFDLGPMRPATYAIQADNDFGVNIMSDPAQERQEITVIEGGRQDDLVLTYAGPTPPSPKNYFNIGGNRRIAPSEHK